MKKFNYLHAGGWIILIELIGSIGVIFTNPAIPTWYAGLAKPAFSPPNWLFAPVWIVLFALIGLAIYLILLHKKSQSRDQAITFFVVQLVLNVLWSAIFFGLHLPLLAFVEILLLWIAILYTAISFYKLSRLASYLLIPYILWVTFAAILNFSIALLN
jgi:tryptophan-rich sensory protein